MCEELRFQLSKAQVEKDEAEKEHKVYRVKTKRDLEMKDQVRDGIIKDIINILSEVNVKFYP